VSNGAAAFSTKDTSDGVARGSLGVVLLSSAFDLDVCFLGEDVGAVGRAAGVLAVGAVAGDLVSVGGGDGDGGLSAKAGSGVRHGE